MWCGMVVGKSTLTCLCRRIHCAGDFGFGEMPRDGFVTAPQLTMPSTEVSIHRRTPFTATTTTSTTTTTGIATTTTTTGIATTTTTGIATTTTTGITTTTAAAATTTNGDIVSEDNLE
jgi:hypothetical protein